MAKIRSSPASMGSRLRHRHAGRRSEISSASSPRPSILRCIAGPRPTRHDVDVDVSKHDMEDTYLPAFRAAVTEGKAESVMCAYNSINGQPACANDFPAGQTLRGAGTSRAMWFPIATPSPTSSAAIISPRPMAEAAAVSLKHGVDNDCADFSAERADNSDYDRYVDAMKQGL